MGLSFWPREVLLKCNDRAGPPCGNYSVRLAWGLLSLRQPDARREPPASQDLITAECRVRAAQSRPDWAARLAICPISSCRAPRDRSQLEIGAALGLADLMLS